MSERRASTSAFTPNDEALVREMQKPFQMREMRDAVAELLAIAADE